MKNRLVPYEVIQICKSKTKRPKLTLIFLNHSHLIFKNFLQVFKAFSKDDKRYYAVKITVEPFHSPADRELKLREVQKHELLPKHPNLISYVRAWEEYGFLYIQTELCQCRFGFFE